MEWKCLICGGRKPRKQRIAVKFCSTECYEKAKIKKCKFCGEEFKCAILSERFCKTCKEDKNKRGRDFYHKKILQKKCKNCEKLFYDKRQVLLCKECKAILPSPLIHHYEDVLRQVLCFKCGKKVEEEKVKKSWRTLDSRAGRKLCPACRNRKDFEIKINALLRKVGQNVKDKILNDVEVNYELSDDYNNKIKQIREIVQKRKEKEIEHKSRLQEQSRLRMEHKKLLELKKQEKAEHRKEVDIRKKNRLDCKKLLELEKTLKKEEKLKQKEQLKVENKEKLERLKLKQYIREELNRLSLSRKRLRNSIKDLKNKIKTAQQEKKREDILNRKRQKKQQYKKVTEEDKIINKAKMVKNMKINNPMFREDVRRRVSKTFKDKIEKGLIKYKCGPEHHLWKGNRGFNLDCRSRLYTPWIFKIMQRDNFKCTMCGKTKKLQVHHVRTLRSIIGLVLKNNGVEHIKDIDTSSKFYEELIEKVVAEHKLNDGITLCYLCHDKIDERYRRYKGEGKKNI